MKEILALAAKDLRLLTRNRGALFFALVWPLMIALLFGAIFSGGNDEGAGRIRVALVDEDDTPASRAFADRLSKSAGIEAAHVSRAEAADAVRRGQRQAFVRIPRGFGERTRTLFYGQSPEIEVGIDPSRKAETAMLEGILMQHAAEDMQKTLNDPVQSRAMTDRALAELRRSNAQAAGRESTERFLSELKTFLAQDTGSPSNGTQDARMNWQPLRVNSQPVTRERSGPPNAFALTLPQGAIWGLVGCAASFAIGLVAERTRGTLVRLQVAPLSRMQVLAGKAVACFLSAAAIQVLVFSIGAVAFGVRPDSLLLLAVAVLSACTAFTGIMMLLSVLGRTEQAVSGSSWAVVLFMSMIGGGMVPLFVMPRWMLSISNISPVKWAIVALEGAIWRGFSISEMLLPCGILLAVGIVSFTIGSRVFRTV